MGSQAITNLGGRTTLLQETASLEKKRRKAKKKKIRRPSSKGATTSSRARGFPRGSSRAKKNISWMGTHQSFTAYPRVPQGTQGTEWTKNALEHSVEGPLAMRIVLQELTNHHQPGHLELWHKQHKKRFHHSWCLHCHINYFTKLVLGSGVKEGHRDTHDTPLALCSSDMVLG